MKEMMKQWRKKAGLSQKELAKKLFVTPSAISQYESGKREPNFDTLKQIADVCHQPFTIQIQEEITMKKINEELARKEMMKLTSEHGLLNVDEREIEHLIKYVESNESIYINRKNHIDPKKAVVYALADFFIEGKPLHKAKSIYAKISAPSICSFDDLDFLSLQVSGTANEKAPVIIQGDFHNEAIYSNYEVTIIGLGY